MKTIIKALKAFLIICIFILVFIGGGYRLYSRFFLKDTPYKNEIPENLLAENKAIAATDVLSTSGIVYIEKIYTKCSHRETETINPPSSYTLKSESEILSLFPDAKLVSSSENKIHLKITKNTKCNQHYLAKESGGKIVITLQNNPNSIIEETNTPVYSLPADDINALMTGIKLESKEELTSFLEDYTS